MVDNTESHTQVKLFVDGFESSVWNRSAQGKLFSLGVGNLIVGSSDSSNQGIRGWFDEFKVLAYEPNLEVICNHAHGTLVGLNSGAPAMQFELAARYPTSSHEQISTILRSEGKQTSQYYRCYANAFDGPGVRLSQIPPDTFSIRQELLFPEGQFVWNRPRPDSSKNQFCMSCHTTNGDAPVSLSLSALAPKDLPMYLDSRRRPTEARSFVSGIIPQGYYPLGPTTTTATPRAGTSQDQYLFPSQ